jgi:hypothetical protein
LPSDRLVEIASFRIRSREYLQIVRHLPPGQSRGQLCILNSLRSVTILLVPAGRPDPRAFGESL